MPDSLLQKIVRAHLISGKTLPGEEIGLQIDQAFCNDATGPLAFLQFEATDLPRVQTEVSVAYVDRATAQLRAEESDEQRYMETAARRFGAFFSRAGNGTGPQVHTERFAAPGKTILGADSLAPLCGAVGALAFGAAGLDVAAAFAGAPFYLPMPRVVGIRLSGALGPWVTAKDVGLEVLRRLTARGGVGRVLEFHGDALEHLGVGDRLAIAAMACQTGAVSVLFPSDAQTRRFLDAQARVRHFEAFAADPGCVYDESLDLDLAGLEPLVSRPGSPDDVVPVREAGAVRVAQVVVGSDANGAPADLKAVADLTGEHGIQAAVAVAALPASRQSLLALARSGDLERLHATGWRVLEPGAGPALGAGLAPPSGGVSVRTFCRNQRGRSGNPDDQVYLASPLVAAAAAMTGQLVDPRTLGMDPPRLDGPERLPVDDRLLLAPDPAVEIARGPHIRPLPLRGGLETRLAGQVVGKVGDRVTADAILPATPDTQAVRTDLALLAEHVFGGLDPGFASRCRGAGGGILVAGAEFGAGPSRELAALALVVLGIRAVVARDFARVFRMHLINAGILPLLLADSLDGDKFAPGDALEIPDVRGAVRGDDLLVVRNMASGGEIRVRHGLTERQKDVLLAGGAMAWARRFARVPAGV
ncbi:MAG: aconitate hydratase [Candidatus Sericytochromatia bacterium]|nr:aconitate hydratase [Candidatus Tanganyikabacteria bacterium]